MTIIRRASLLVFACLLFSLPRLSPASGFGIFVHGATALGEGLATTAHGSNPQVVFYNPALLGQLEGTQVENGGTLVVPAHDFKSDVGNTSHKTDSVVYFPTTVYVAHKYNERLSFGLGIFSPFGLGTNWDGNWEGRYIVTDVEMATLNFNPVLAYQVTPTLSLAAGIDLLYVDTTLKNKINFSPLGFADGRQKLSGDGTGLGFNLGLHTPLSEDLAFGLSYRSGINVDLEGDIRFKLPSPTLEPAFPTSKAETSIDFPAQLHAAFAYSGFDGMTIEVGARWEDWSSYDELRVETAQAIAGTTSSRRVTDWEDTWTLTVGGRYRLTPDTHLLAGFVRGQDPIPDKYFEPSITDSPHYAITLGSEHRIDKHTLAVAYSYQKWFDRDKNNAVGGQFSGGTVADARANGKYRAHSHFLALSFTYVF